MARLVRPGVFLALLCGGIALAKAQSAPAPSGPAPETVASPSAPSVAPVATPTDPAPTANPALKGYDPQGGRGKRLHVVPIEGEIELGLASFVQRVLGDTQPDDVVVLEVRTFGGRIDAAVEIRDALLAAKVPTVAFVHRGISAGALISLACDTIIMVPGGSIGAATPVQQGEGGEMKPTSEKVVSYMRAEMGSTADAKGRRRDIAEAMVDADVEIAGLKPKGKVLTLTTVQALEVKIADAQAGSLAEALALLNLGEAQRIDEQADWAETLARFLTNSAVSSLLMTIGLLGLMSELLSPGVGVRGLVGLACLVLFFFGQFAAKLAGVEEILLFVVGCSLLALEIFVIPGFGVAGVLGIVCMLLGLAMALVEIGLPLDVSFELGFLQEAVATAVTQIGLVIFVLAVGAVLMFKYLPGARTARWLVLQTPSGSVPDAGGAETRGSSLKISYAHLRGQRGRAHTVLRPSGMAVIGGERFDVLAQGEFIDAGRTIEVIAVDGAKIVVRAVEKSDEPASA